MFSTLTEARRAITSSKEDYNHHRPPSALGNLLPAEFATKFTMENPVA
ncbi:transposase [Aurantimonas sp. DM33-3]|nr:transposase [Aurantimonas sp. DM33-3]